MTSKVAAAVTGLLAVVLAVGCGNVSGVEPTDNRRPQVAFLIADLSTSVHAVTLAITNGPNDVAPDTVNWVAHYIRVATFPGDVVVPATQSIVTIPGSVSPNGVPVPASAQVQEELDAGLNESEWYAVSLPQGLSQYVVVADGVFGFAGGMMGVRLSPAHPPVVASVMSCPKGTGVIAVYVRYSEPVIKTAGALSLDFTAYPVSCSIGDDSPTETQFICVTGAGAEQPFLLRVPDGVTAQASGRPMAPATLDPAAMQHFNTPDGCQAYKPMTVN